MVRRVTVLGAMVLSAAVAMGADKIKSKDADFLKDAAMGAMAEVEMGHIAAQQGASDAVKSFGRRMVADHGSELTELRSLARSKGVDLPAELDKKHMKMADKMRKMSGSDFDKAYARDMLEDHKTDLKDFKKEADKASDPDVKSFAAKQVPTLEEHLSLAGKLPGNTSKKENAAVAAREGHHSREHAKAEDK
jgi:putative membrane protein